MTTYTYKGDRLTDPSLKGKTCTAVRRADGKCMRGANSNMLVDFDGVKVVVLARLLRKNKTPRLEGVAGFTKLSSQGIEAKIAFAQ